MSRNIDRQEAFRIAAEKMRLQKEKEERENNEFYKRITSGNPWLIFKSIVIFCTLISVLTTIEVLVDGPSKKLTKADWKIDHDWEWTWHQVLDVEGYMFGPELGDWLDHIDGTLELTYSPIFRTGKKLSYNIEVNESNTRHHTEIRMRSIFTWFPVLQLFLLIPLLTFIFKKQKPWFNFARIASIFFIFPGAIMIIYFALLQ